MTPDQSMLFGKLFPLLFMMMGPVGLIPVFAAVSGRLAPGACRHLAFKTFAYAFVSILIAIGIGASVLVGWGASPASLIIASGLLLLIAALKGIFGAATSRSTDDSGPGDTSALALSPLAFPTIVSPHGIGVVIIFVAFFPSATDKTIILGAALAVLLLDLLAMMYARKVMALVGMTPLRILGAVFGVLQVALALEMLISGIMKSKLAG